MITEKRIAQGNKRIAAFVGMKQTSVPILFDTTGDEFIERFMVGSVPVDEVMFHRSWDWLMPVVRKINDEMSSNCTLTPDQNGDGGRLIIGPNSVKLRYASWVGKTKTITKVKMKYDYEEFTDIEAAWTAVVEIIDLHNDFLRTVKRLSEINYMDVRVKYKLSTGEYPTYGKDSEGVGLFRGDNVTGKYGMWMEENFYDGNREEFLRKEYRKATGQGYPVGSNHHKMAWRYDRDYVLWLEQYLIASGMFDPKL